MSACRDCPERPAVGRRGYCRTCYGRRWDRGEFTTARPFDFVDPGTTWMESASCKSVGHEYFFPCVSGDVPSRLDVPLVRARAAS